MDKLRLGVIGCGSVVREIYQYLYFASEYSSFIEVAAIADPYEKGLNEFGDQYDIPKEVRFATHSELIQNVELDAVMVNTPDSLHAPPTIEALEKGLDVLVPKPTADSIKEAHAMISASRKTGRLLGVDFHKRDDPRIKEGTARYQDGQYGPFQTSIWYMIDKLQVADPNHEPRFFASADFAEKNTPVSFLTVHMCDAFLNIVSAKPVTVRATGFKQKLPSLKPIAVNGYDLVDTEIRFESGALCHIITGWALPNTAHALTVQSARIVCRDGMLDLGLDTPGYHELVDDGIIERNPLFRNFEPDGTVSGYGMSSPGKSLRQFCLNRNGELTDEMRARLDDPFVQGFYTTAVLEAAHESLDQGETLDSGAVIGPEVKLADLLVRELGEEDAKAYL